MLVQGPRQALVPGVTGWIGVTGSAFNGGSFVNHGLNLSSMLMATLFAVAATSYVLAMAVQLPPRHRA